MLTSASKILQQIENSLTSLQFELAHAHTSSAWRLRVDTRMGRSLDCNPGRPEHTKIVFHSTFRGACVSHIIHLVVEPFGLRQLKHASTAHLLFGVQGLVLQDCICSTASAHVWQLELAQMLYRNNVTMQSFLERERERFATSIQPAWLMRTGLYSCLSLMQQG